MITTEQVEKKWLSLFENIELEDYDGTEFVILKDTPTISQIMIVGENEITLTITYKLC